MNGYPHARWCGSGLLLFCLAAGLAAETPTAPKGPDLAVQKQVPGGDTELPQPRASDPEASARRKKMEDIVKKAKRDPAIQASLPKPADSILPAEMNAIDLGCVLRLAGVENPDILIARQRVARAQALRFLAFSFVLPNLNAGFNYDDHNGPLQQSSGNILTVNRQALYTGLGAGAIAAGTVGIPGVQYNVNFSEGIFTLLTTRYNLRARQAEAVAVRNQILLRVATAYLELVRAESWRSIALRNQEEAREIAYLTAAKAKLGANPQADADRAAAELARRNGIVVESEQAILVASAHLAALLNIPPSVQMHAVDGWVVPTEIVPNVLPLQELLYTATQQRPELAARRNIIQAAVMHLRNEIFLPLSPTVLAGYSAGTFGGGSNLVAAPQGFGGFQAPFFGNFGARDDVDVLMVWTAQNMGVGNLGRIRVARSERRITELELIRELNIVRDEVATAYARTHAHYAQIDLARRGVEASARGFAEDYKATMERGNVLTIELLNNFHLLAQARMEYLNTVIDYDIAQFALYVAMGQPPTRNLAHEVPNDLVPVPKPAPPLPACVPPGGNPAACLGNTAHP